MQITAEKFWIYPYFFIMGIYEQIFYLFEDEQ